MTVVSSERLDISYTRILCPINQNMIIFILSPSGYVRNKFMNVNDVENIVLLTIKILDVVKFTTLPPLLLQILCILSCPVVGFKMLSLPTLALKNFCTVFR